MFFQNLKKKKREGKDKTNVACLTDGKTYNKKRLVTKNSFILEEIIFQCSVIPDPKFPIPLSLLKPDAESLKNYK